MSHAPRPAGRRERNKQEKFERITAAARDLFTEHGVDDVTTQQIAERADVGTGTVFLYARTKAELLLLVQNSAYESALRRGREDAARTDDPVQATLAVLGPIAECNRTQVDNGRTYLREVIFGDPDEPHHRTALDLIRRTELEVAGAVRRTTGGSDEESATLAQIVTAIAFVSLATSQHLTATVPQILDDVRRQLSALLRGRTLPAGTRDADHTIEQSDRLDTQS